MLKDVNTKKYYIIYTIITKGVSNLLYPFIYDSKEESEEDFSKMESGDFIFNNDETITTKVFLYAEKTYLSKEVYEEDELGEILTRQTEIINEIIPTDYVSDLFYKRELDLEPELKEMVRDLIEEASEGMENE